MIFTTKEDIEAPIETVFAAVSDFEGFERTALRRGAKVQRTTPKTPSAQIAWNIEATTRGKKRNILAELTEMDNPTRLFIESASGGLTANTSVDLVELSRNRTRLKIEFEIKPRTLGARLLVQSLRLAKNSLTKKFKQRIAQFATDIENRNA
jgi:carbon monoxide dehydrogenase subunit G